MMPLPSRLNSPITEPQRALVCSRNLPQLRLPGARFSSSINVEFRPKLTRHRGQLLSGTSQGTEVYAASYLRERRIVLESELLDDPAELARILAHELFHFSWLRLGNPARAAWSVLLEVEYQKRARGELGWSAEWRKKEWKPGLPPARWKDYICESFCDTAAWLYAGLEAHDEWSLAPRWRQGRREFFEKLAAEPVRF
jgi:hypothetical protein